MKNLAGTKLLALLVALLTVVGMLALGAVTAFAGGTGTEEDPYIVDTWADLKEKMAAGGYIKLNADVTDPDKTQESSLSVPDGVAVELDLNGHTVDRGGSHLRYGYVICVGGSGAELTIRDSAGGGKITGGNHKQYSSSPLIGGGICVMGGTVNLYGGEISGNNISNVNGGKRYGGGIAIAGGTFNMYGGAVKKNSASYYGGGVYLENAVFYLYDGEISGNTTATRGAGVYLAGNSTFTMTGGRIAENVTGSDGYGGGVYLSNYNSGTGSSTFTMTGGEIFGNKTQTGEFYNQSGGAAGVYVGRYDTFNMTGGSVTGNVSSYNGSYYKTPSGAVTLFGTFTVSGDAVISGNLLENTKNETDPTYTGSDLHLRNDYDDEIALNVGELTEGARIGIYSEKAPTDNGPIPAVLDFVADNPENEIGDFFFSNQAYRLDLDDSGNVLLYPHVHDATLVPEVPAGCTTYGKQAYYHCETCGMNFEIDGDKQEITDPETWGRINPTGHAYTYVAATNPSCTEGGKAAYYRCANCGKSFYLSEDPAQYGIDPEEIISVYPDFFYDYAVEIDDLDSWGNDSEALGHDWGEWTLTLEPGCETQGEETRVCNRDPAHSEVRTIEALGHDFGEWTVTKPATEEAGEETRVCSRDPSHLEVRAIPATTGTAPKPETEPAKPAAEPEKSNTGVIIAVVAAAVVVAGGGIAAVVLIKKKKAS